MSYDTTWLQNDQRRQEWLEKLYRLDGRHHECHPNHALYTGLVEKYGACPWI